MKVTKCQFFKNIKLFELKNLKKSKDKIKIK